MMKTSAMNLEGRLTDEDREYLDGRTVVLSVSGGKDSTATGLWLKESGVAFLAVHMDTGWEHPLTEAYVRETLPGVLGVPVDIVSSVDGSMVELAIQWGGFPRRMVRWCTRYLKLRPFESYIAGVDKAINAIGVRADESKSRADLTRWSVEAGDNSAVRTWRPLIGWTFEDVADIHRRHGVAPNPLYLRYGATRVGCWPCIYARKAEIAAMAKHDPQRIDYIDRLEQEIGSTFFSDPIRTVAQWAATGRGGRQMLLDIPPEPGCVRWGMCEHIDD